MMKRPKRIPALLLALVLALGLMTPALAAGSDYSPTFDDFLTHFDLDVSDGHNEDVDFRLLNWGYDESKMEEYYYGHHHEPTYVQPEQLTYYYQIPSDAVFTVANTAKGIDCKLTISMSCWSNHAYDVEVLPESGGNVNAVSGGVGPEMRLPEGDYLYLNTADLWLYKDKSWNEYIGYPPPEDLMLTLTPGQSCTFDLSEIHLEGQGMSALADPKNDNIYTIYISITYASGKRMYAGYVFHTGEKDGETRVELPTVSSWAQDEVAAARAAGLIPALSGNPGYQDAITREQFAELVMRLVQVTSPEVTASITEVHDFDDCYNTAVLLASEVGIVNGVGDNKFAPEQTTNREQIAAMIARAIGVIETAKSVDLTPAPASIENFTDKGQVSGWAVEGVGTLAANGIMNGTSSTTLSPKSGCTVEQSICLIYRVYQTIQAKS